MARLNPNGIVSHRPQGEVHTLVVTVTPDIGNEGSKSWCNAIPSPTRTHSLSGTGIGKASNTVQIATPWLNSTPLAGLEEWLTTTSVPSKDPPSWMPTKFVSHSWRLQAESTATPRPAPETRRYLAYLTIVLDPGHGGADPGALHNGWLDADVNLAVARLLRSALGDLGGRVVLTRDDDSSVLGPHARENDELQARADVANRARADLFISIHADASSDPELSGVLTFSGPQNGYAAISVRSRRLVARSHQLARAIQRELVAASGQPDHGVRLAPFWVIGEAKLPAVLVEVGFLTNGGDLRRLTDDRSRTQIVAGMIRGIQECLRDHDDAVFVQDLTVPDGTPMRPGGRFSKIWLIRNVGQQIWSSEYRLTHTGKLTGWVHPRALSSHGRLGWGKTLLSRFRWLLRLPQGAFAQNGRFKMLAASG